MTTTRHLVGTLLTIALVGCATEAPGSSSGPTGPGGKADGASFVAGIYYSDGLEDDSEDTILAVALHEDSEAPTGYAGAYDLATYQAADGETVHTSGWFKIGSEDGGQRYSLDAGDGSSIELRYEDDRLWAWERSFYRFNLLNDENVLADCVAFEVSELYFEEGFTVWEYPHVDIERTVEGGYDVSIGAAGFDPADGDTITVETDGPTVVATVVTDYGSRFVVEVPKGMPSRGHVWVAEEGEELREIASTVCLLPSNGADEPSVTHFTCTTRREEASGTTATIEFDVESLDDHDAMTLHWPEDVELPIRVDPETSAAYTLVGGIADGYLRWTDGKLRLFTDQIGYEFGELELYENSDYTRGYFRFELHDPENTSFYTEVDCTHD